MKKNFVRAALVACLSLFVMGSFVAAPAAAADSSKPTLSRAVGKPFADVLAAYKAQDWPTMLAKLKEVQAVPDQTDYDKYIIATYFGLAYYNTNDTTSAAASFLAAAELPGVPDEERGEAFHRAMTMEYNAQNFPKVIELGQYLTKPGITPDERDLSVLASAYYNIGDFANANTLAQKILAMDATTNKTPDRAVYQIVFGAQNKQHDIAGETRTLETMVNLFGEPDDWSRLIDVTLTTLNSPNKNNREMAALFVYRLRLATGSDTSADDYLLMADLALGANSPGDALHALQTGINKGVLSQGKAAAVLAKTNARVRGDEAALPGAEAAAAKSPSANGDVSVAEGYFGYQRYADAARVAQRAVGKGGPKVMEAQLLLGAAQAMQGDNTGAAATFGQVKGDPSMEQVAKLWTVYATRKYGQSAAAPASH